LGKAENDVLQRIYGVSFPTKQELTKHLEFLEEAKRRDHRRIGAAQELFTFHEWSAGCAFFLPHGTRIYNKLMELSRAQYRKRGYSEVLSPNIFNSSLWECSGHWMHYKDDMFTFDVEGQQYAMKPMNCPGHCLMFGIRTRSHRELPLRYADFGILHRNELHGALTGLTRVRRFQQDDCHIFCSKDQISHELNNEIDFMKEIYGIFGFKFTLELSTRPEKYLGDIQIWDNAEKVLRDTLNERFGEGKWNLNPGDGAFYGPKIDIHVHDAIGRSHQCATIQVRKREREKERKREREKERKREREKEKIYYEFSLFILYLISFHLSTRTPFFLHHISSSFSSPQLPSTVRFQPPRSI
jgi:threonyl-tRNA synthetase